MGQARYLPAAKQNPVRQGHGGAKAKAIIYRQGEFTEDIFVLCQGWGARFIQLSNGQRQILSVLMPGDLFTPASLWTDKQHFSVQAVTDVRFSRFSRADLTKRVIANMDILRALGTACVSELREMDELVVDLGRRNAEGRVAHVILRLVERLPLRGVGRDRRYPFPLRQRHIADITGLTPVHVSRVMTQFREAGYLELSKGILVVRDLAALERIGRLQ